MIDVPFKDADIDRAVADSKRCGTLKDSFTQGAGQTAGLLAEIAIGNFLGAERPPPGEYDPNFDLRIHGVRVEVKTKRRTVDPRPEYGGMVAAYQSGKQRADWYAFASIRFGGVETTDSGKVYTHPKRITLCGFITPEEFNRESIRFDKGDPVSGKHTALVDLDSILYSQLTTLDQWLHLVKNAGPSAMSQAET